MNFEMEKIGSTADFSSGMDLDSFRYIELVKKKMVESTKKMEISGNKVLNDPGISRKIKQLVRREIDNQREVLKAFFGDRGDLSPALNAGSPYRLPQNFRGV